MYSRRFCLTEASNIEVESTDIIASTIHNAFDLDSELKTKLDLSSMDNKKVKKLHETDLLCLDEISMMVRRRINVLLNTRRSPHGGTMLRSVFVLPRT